MAEIQVQFGTYKNLPMFFEQSENSFYLPTEKILKSKVYPISKLIFFEEATPNNLEKVNSSIDLEKAKSEIRVDSTLGTVFGIVGMVGEALVKGGKITFIAGFKDGTKILATTHEKTYNYILTNFNSLNI